MLCLIVGLVASPTSLVVAGRDVKLVASRVGQVWSERLYASDGKGSMRLVLTSPGSVALSNRQEAGALQGLRKGLYDGVPDFHFSSARVEKTRYEQTAVFEAKAGLVTIVKRVTIPNSGRTLHLDLAADLGARRVPLHALLLSYAFVPGGLTLSRDGLPDSTFLPGLRPRDENVCGDHFFRAPAAVAQKGRIAALLMPDLHVLEDNRPMEAVLDLDAKNGVCDATLLTYGFCAHRLTGHVNFSTDSSMVRTVPGKLKLAADLILDARAEPYAAYEQSADFEWSKYGSHYLNRIKPQMRPFAEYAKECYPAVFDEHYGSNKLGWFETTIDGRVCGGVPSGWGFDGGWVSWQCWFNQIRSAWGLHWWGRKLGNADWIDKSDKMLNLALAAPMKGGACPTTYQSREKVWRGCLVTPDPRCYYDLTNMAWKGIWLLEWLKFADCPRRDEIVRQCKAMADLMISKQNPDGSIPTWLDKDLNVVPILDHSAQTALPVWFLAECRSSRQLYLMNEGMGASMAVGKGADFLLRQVVDQQRYYDFETFFSCSPKACRQMNGVIDDPAMHDPHTLLPPQNTLSMQWTAEALRAAAAAGHDRTPDTGDDHFPQPTTTRSQYRAGAMKALDMMVLYQNVWPISYRKVAYTYGGFGVQNSDGEYDDARQAQFGCTLADFGADLGRQDLFERGVAATRATLALINDPLHASLGIYPNPNYPPGLEPENDGHGGTDEQNGRSGTDWGECSGLTSMAWMLDKYGGGYVHDDPSNGWGVGIDGIMLSQLGDSSSLMPDVLGSEDVEIVTSKGKHQFEKVVPHPRAETSGFGMRDGKFGLSVVLAGDGSSRFEGEFVRDDGAALPAVGYALAEQSGQVERWGFGASLPSDWSGRAIRLIGKAGGWYVDEGPFLALFDPSWSFAEPELPGWQVQGDIPEIPTWSTRLGFGVKAGEGFIGTCEDGKGGFDDRFTGTITSPRFLVSKPNIRLLVGGGSLPGVYVELIEANTGRRLFVERGHNSERMDERVWDVSAVRGRELQIRIVDGDTGGWGHINVGRIRASD